MELVLGVRGLPEPEVNLLRSILRLSTELAGRWRLGEGERCDVLLVEAGDDARAPLGSEGADGRGPRVIQLRRPADGAGGPDVLMRPIRAEALIELLQSHRSSWGQTEPLALDELTLLPQRPPVAEAAPVRAVAAPARPLAARLRRWPSWELLRDSPKAVQLATLLSKNTLTAEGLAVLSNVDRSDCEAFLQVLDGHGLIQWVEPKRAASASAAPQPGLALPRSTRPTAQPADEVPERPMPVVAAAAVAQKRGLLGAIRRSLGL